MKIIDNKGKIFGKINIVDLVAIILIILAVGFVGYKLAMQDGASGSVQPKKLTYTVMASGITQEMYEELEKYVPNGQLLSSATLLDAYIVDMVANPHVEYNYDSDGVSQAKEEQGEYARFDVIFTIEANITDDVTRMVGIQEIRIGKSHVLKTVNIELNTVVQSCYFD